MKKYAPPVLFLFLLLFSPVSAEIIFDKANEYPKELYIIGIGEVLKTGNLLKDRRTAEVLARLRIAEVIKINVRSEMIDLMCDEKRPKLFKAASECRNEVYETIETTVDVFLEGTRIVSQGEKDGTVYAVAVLKRTDSAHELENKAKESAEAARDSLKKAVKGDRDSAEKAGEHYLKAVTYSKEKEAVEGVKGRAANAFDELEKELLKLKHDG